MLIDKRDLYLFCLVSALVFTYASNNFGIYVGWTVGLFFITLNALIWLLNASKGSNVLNASKFIFDKDIFTVFFLKNLCFFWCFLGVFSWVNIWDGVKFGLISIFYALISVCIVGVDKTKNIEYFSKIMFLVALLWVVVNSIFLISFLTGLIEYENNDFSGVYVNRNQFAITTFFLSVFVFYLILINGFRIKYWVVFFLLVFFILITKSMKGVISLLFLFCVFSLNNLSVKKIFLFVFFLLGVVLLLSTTNPISERFFMFIDGVNDVDSLSISSSGYLRMWLLTEGINLSLQHPLFGVGINQSIYYLIPEWYELWFKQGKLDELMGMYSHNNFIEMALNGGFISLILYYMPFLYVYLNLKKYRFTPIESRFFFTLLLVRLIYDWGAVSYYDFVNIFWMCFLIFYSKRPINSLA